MVSAYRHKVTVWRAEAVTELFTPSKKHYTADSLQPHPISYSKQANQSFLAHQPPHQPRTLLTPDTTVLLMVVDVSLSGTS
jgi:hypothetical protein